MAEGPRRSTRNRNSARSGSEYSGGNASASGSNNSIGGDPPADEEEEERFKVSQRGRRVAVKSYRETDSDMDGAFDEEDDEGDVRPAGARRTRPRADLDNFIATDEEGDVHYGRYATRSRVKKRSTPPEAPPPRRPAPTRRRLTRRSARDAEDADVYVDDPGQDGDGDGSLDADELDGAPHTSPSPEPDPEPETGGDGRPYALRQRAKINYAIPPALEEVRPAPAKPRGKGKGRAGPGWSATGAELGRYMGMPADDSDSDYPTRTPRKPFGAGAGGGGMFAAGGGMLPSDLAAAAGTPSNLGKIGDAALADADPLGVNTNVTFDEVGGLDDHVNSLKEMTLLPLLYPEVFQRFNVTPPRGVLFHGPPGTGKTLLARALAASCRSNGKGISFFMRKGADCLSKWVGEAERQLRLLFEEARNSQPSIIFFDEIDGLAPVRSSKQDQIHASIVSTLLALMDGMDGRGQVIVIGATNRPDAIDPALRRPGRFDREFYFPLPNLEARTKILRIMTRGWEGWDEERAEETIQGLAKVTKGYGGADLRALCTEAALNAVQRRYPQIYKSNDRLLLKPETIDVVARDFMLSVKKLIPSSARSASSTASPLPAQFVPLLSDTLEKVKLVLNKALPVEKKRTALEEAEWEDGGDEAALERELLLQSMETLRIHRPRVVLHGPVGMGQGYVGAAALHHLEGYHVQSLDLGSLMGDSTRTVDAAIVQLFVEAKRHQPSVVYIPSLIGWCAAVPEASRSTVRAMLDSLAPTDPILLLAVVDGSFSSLPRDVRSWFGITRENRVAFTTPTADQRSEFFKELFSSIRRPPNLFPDGIKRKKRVLEELAIAPPLEPKQPTAAELALQEENDQRVIALLKYRLGPILTELKRKFKRFTKRAADEYNFGPELDYTGFFQAQTTTTTTTTTHVELAPNGNGYLEIVDEEHTIQEPNGHITMNGTDVAQPPLPPLPKLHDIDLERIHADLYKGKYLTPNDFLEDIGKIVHNAEVRASEDLDRLHKALALFTAAEVSMHEFDPQLRLECERMAVRERRRREEHRKAKGKGKATENGNGNGGAYALGTRRSTRHNGQQMEISITDPVQLERRLKRQRSRDPTGDSQGSGEEGEDGPKAKRSRPATSEEEGDHDPLEVMGPTPSQIQSPPATPAVGVRFHLGVSIESPREAPMGSLMNMNGIVHQPLSTPTPAPALKTSGFPPSLLNPLDPADNLFSSQPPPTQYPYARNDMHLYPPFSSIPIPIAGPSYVSDDPFRSEPIVAVVTTQPLLDQTSLPHTPFLTDDQSLFEQQQSQVPAEPERTPTPLPEFHLDEYALSGLENMLRDRTGSLNVEQLEQLRATSLGCVWRRRADWNRNDLVSELADVVKEFVEEASLDEMDVSPFEQ